MRPRPKPEAGIAGAIMAIVSLLLLIPVLPFIAVLWAIDRVRGGDRARRTIERFDARSAEDSAER